MYMYTCTMASSRLHIHLHLFFYAAVEVWICHVVSVGEFYVQCLEQRLALEQLSLSISSLSPGPLSADNLKEGH